jgi:CheY-like chemotaxis protein
MPAFVKLGDIKGQATDADHKDWIIIQSLTSPIYRTIPKNARDQQDALAAGADFYLTKPFRPGELLRVIEQVMRMT